MTPVCQRGVPVSGSGTFRRHEQRTEGMQVLCLSPIFRQSTSRQTSESAYRDSVRRFVAPPEKRPGGVNARILLAWVAYKSEQNAKNGGKAEQEASLLHVQQMLRFSTENQASAVLKRLRTSASPSEGPWLAVSTPSRGVRRHAIDGGFVQQHVLNLEWGSGSGALPGCVVVQLRDGLIARVDEYLDGATIASFGA
jgi:hypothetical protein